MGSEIRMLGLLLPVVIKREFFSYNINPLFNEKDNEIEKYQ